MPGDFGSSLNFDAASFFSATVLLVLRKLNPFLKNLDDDVLYHISLSKKTHDFKQMFGDVKVEAARLVQ